MLKIAIIIPACTPYPKDTASCVSARTVHGCTVSFGSGREGGTCWRDQRFLLKWLRYRPEHDVKLLVKRWELCVVVQWKAADMAQLVRAVGTFPVFGRHGVAGTSLGLCGWLHFGGPRWSQSQMTNPNALETGSSTIRTPMRRQTRREPQSNIARAFSSWMSQESDDEHAEHMRQWHEFRTRKLRQQREKMERDLVFEVELLSWCRRTTSSKTVG